MLIYSIIQCIIWIFISSLSQGVKIPDFLSSSPIFIQKAANGFYYELSNSSMPFELFLIFFTLSFLVYAFSVLNIKKTKANKRTLLIVFVSSILMRLFLLPSIPIHENDIYRYLWDGKVSLAGINPYQYAPAQAILGEGVEDPVVAQDYEKLNRLFEENKETYRRISYKDVPTIYPPLTQAFFAVSNLLMRESIVFMKFLVVLFELISILLLMKILGLLNINPLYSIIYAWNPLVLKEFANSGHYDALCIVLVLAAIYMYLKERSKTSAIYMGLAVLAKFYPLIFLPFYLKKKKYRAFLISLFIIFIFYLPVFLWGQIDFMQVFTGLGTYAKSWAVNGAFFELFYSVFTVFTDNSYFIAKGLSAITFIVFWFYIFSNKSKLASDWVKDCFYVLTALFLLSPVGDPWYYCWLIPFLCIYKSKSLILLSYLLILSYLDFSRDLGFSRVGEFSINNIVALQYLPFYAFFIYELVQSRKYSGKLVFEEL